MNFELKAIDLKSATLPKTDALVILVPNDVKPSRDALSALIHEASQSANFKESAGKVLSLWKPAPVAVDRLVLVSCASAQPKHIRQAIQAAAPAIKNIQAKHVTLCLPTWVDNALTVAMQTLAEAMYVYTATKPSAKPNSLKRVVLGLPTAQIVKQAKPEFAYACALVAGIAKAKEWANLPANHATPSALAKAAQALARNTHMRCEVLGPREIAKLGMGAFQAVTQGSQEPARFIVLHYQGAAKTQAPTVLVGKGITFDTGGISIKPAAGMDEMKFDMCGAASVLGTFEALAHLKPAINVVGLIPTCENMPSGTAIKPGDVVTSMDGQTIEILNTDAEGRLILCDALTYAKRFKPQAVIDIATLTGACVVSLGAVRSGLFSPADALAQALMAAGDASHDLCWRLPLDDEYAEGLKSNFADVAMVGRSQQPNSCNALSAICLGRI